jgi:hypothetical protein
MTLPVLEPGHRGGKPSINLLTYGTASFAVYEQTKAR